jgi:hypothetical protein
MGAKSEQLGSSVASLALLLQLTRARTPPERGMPLKFPRVLPLPPKA